MVIGKGADACQIRNGAQERHQEHEDDKPGHEWINRHNDIGRSVPGATTSTKWHGVSAGVPGAVHAWRPDVISHQAQWDQRAGLSF